MNPVCRSCRRRHQVSRGPIARLWQVCRAIRNSKPWQPVNSFTLARELEVCPKTIQRDLEFLRDRLQHDIQFDPHTKNWSYRTLPRETYL